MTNEERYERGLTTIKQYGVDYSASFDDTKVCRCCQEKLDVGQFYLDRDKKDGFRSICKKCDIRHSKYIYCTANNKYTSVKNQLKNTEIKQKTLDFIFGVSKENPIKR